MSNRDRGQRDLSDEMDALLSAEIEGELDLDDRARLDDMIAGDEHVAAAERARAFHVVDQAVRSLADVSADGARLSASYSRLTERLGLSNHDSESLHAATAWPMAAWRALFPIAAAAALILYLSWPVSDDAMGRDLRASSPSSSIDPDLQDELELVLGYGDESSEIGGVSIEDLDVIEDLDLLDFLASRDLKENG